MTSNLPETLPEDNYDLIDEALSPFSGLLEQLSDLDGWLDDPQWGVQMQLENADLELPVQLQVGVGEQGRIVIGASPPLYFLETSIMPVFHQITVRVEAV
jgi:hypothetical protein